MAMRINVHIEDDTAEGIATCEFLEAAGRRKGDFIVAAVAFFAKALGMQPSGSPEQIEGMILISKFANTPMGMANMFPQQLNEPVRRSASKPQKKSTPKPKPKASKLTVPTAAPQPSAQSIPAPATLPPVVKPQPEPKVVDDKAEEEAEVLEYIRNNVDIKKLKEEIGDFQDDGELKLLLQVMTLEDGTTYYQKYHREILDMLMANKKANPVIDLSDVSDVSDTASDNNVGLVVGGFGGLMDGLDLDDD